MFRTWIALEIYDILLTTLKPNKKYFFQEQPGVDENSGVTNVCLVKGSGGIVEVNFSAPNWTEFGILKSRRTAAEYHPVKMSHFEFANEWIWSFPFQY